MKNFEVNDKNSSQKLILLILRSVKLILINLYFQERRRLKERYPSLALVYKDQEQCGLMLNNYEELLLSRTICEGKCALGEQCPTGVCRSVSLQKRPRCRSTSRSQSEMRRSPSTTSTSSMSSVSSMRPRSGPAGLRSYTGNIASTFEIQRGRG